jgi:hypothetical protein
MTDMHPIRMTYPGRFKQEAKLAAILDRYGLDGDQSLWSDGDTYHAVQIDRPCYFDLLIELKDDAKAAPLITELSALGFEVELADGDAEAITHTVQ